ncbi:hypothetical protein PVK62_08190 [Aliivibrio sp. S3MY1]|uniref:Uncharacterized protein n=1 Tax=Aliivibrio wodanis TaxID=80852 RepID=A0A5Q4ZYQ2_9GAMM|nr:MULTISPECIES: hypothetical protein [Aliivibrio]MDD9175970.1 hypothetical protein [Aliivibrio sp. S3TY1]MDD9193115.1 hypothetical protein [Aliivibrio sp. S2TY2]MDD9195819.1 hypothetical protein [Aliivibrio sp. S3MY1]VVV06994.1 hypothetical protein AW0309160_04488 [Aliivibrio wodanis]
MSKNISHEKVDPAMQAAIEYGQFIRKEIVFWFGIMWVSFGLVIHTAYQFYTIQSFDYNRGYIAINDHETPLKTTPLTQPHPNKSDAEIIEWAIKNLTYCLTFDNVSYAMISSECNANKFSLNRQKENSEFNHGQLFYRALEKSELIKIMISNSTSMTVDIKNVVLKNKGIKQRATPSGMKGFYTYELDMTLRFLIYGQRLDAPIRYIVTLERMSEISRREAIGIRSMVSND